MKGRIKYLPAVTLAMASFALADVAHAQASVNDWGPSTAPVTLRLAAGVQTAPAYYAPAETYVGAITTPIYAEMNVYGRTTGQEIKRGQKADILAYTAQGHWLLVGRNGEGIGYVPRSMMTPERYWKDQQSAG